VTVRSRWSWFMDFAPARAAVGALLLSAAMSAVMVSVESLPRSDRRLWPSVVAAVLMALTYRFYARRIEHRPGKEFALKRAPVELTGGLAGGAGLVGAAFAVLTALHAFGIQGRHALGGAAVDAASEMILVAFFEVILVRGIVLQGFERPLGSIGAVLASSLLFGMLHLPNHGAALLSTVNVTVAGVMFGAAFVATRRLWLCIGLHLGWNFTANYVFSAVVSGHEGRAGLIFGTLSGPDWITGGAFGIEGSVVTLVALLASTSLLLAWRRHRSNTLTHESGL
jgi:membrane protease YdiL (CAAX protease family)